MPSPRLRLASNASRLRRPESRPPLRPPPALPAALVPMLGPDFRTSSVDQHPRRRTSSMTALGGRRFCARPMRASRSIRANLFVLRPVEAEFVQQRMQILFAGGLAFAARQQLIEQRLHHSAQLGSSCGRRRQTCPVPPGATARARAVPGGAIAARSASNSRAASGLVARSKSANVPFSLMAKS